MSWLVMNSCKKDNRFIDFVFLGSGKSTLAKSLNNGYNGQILSIDDYFKGMNSNEYLFDSSKLEDAHLYNRRLGLFEKISHQKYSSFFSSFRCF